MADARTWRPRPPCSALTLAAAIVLICGAPAVAAPDCDALLKVDDRAPADVVGGQIQKAFEGLVRDPARRSQRPELLECVLAPVLGDLAAGGPLAPAAEARLGFLGQRAAWESSGTDDLDSLKKVSRALKADPAANADAIALVDSAILQHKGELADALRPKATYPEHLAEKARIIARVRSEGTYQGGPYELFVDEVEALHLEEQFFLDARESGGTGDPALLTRALALYDVMLAKLADPMSAATDRQRRYFVNDIRFRAAVDALLVGETARANDLLRAIVAAGETWAPTGSLDHVYVRRFLRLPLDIRVDKTAEGVRISYDDSAELKRFYNPRQIALYLCGLAADPDLFRPPYRRLEDALLGFENFDYRVYLESSSDRDRLEKIRDDYRNRLQAEVKEAGARQTRKLDYGGDLVAIADIAESRPFRTVAREGASACLGDGHAGIDDIAAVDLDLRGTWEHGENPDRKIFGIYFGGNLTFDEATNAAGILRALLKLRQEPYLARPTIDG
jgi:hypothetical protein